MEQILITAPAGTDSVQVPSCSSGDVLLQSAVKRVEPHTVPVPISENESGSLKIKGIDWSFWPQDGMIPAMATAFVSQERPFYTAGLCFQMLQSVCVG